MSELIINRIEPEEVFADSPEITSPEIDAALEAMIDGVGIVDGFISNDTALQIAQPIGDQIVGEDIYGVPINSEPDDFDIDWDVSLEPRTRFMIKQIERRMHTLLHTAIGDDNLSSSLQVSTEAIKYLESTPGMEWHFDNYNLDPDRSSFGSDTAAVINGVSYTVRGSNLPLARPHYR